MFERFLRSLSAFCRTHGRRGPKPNQNRPLLEHLEDRVVPATLVSDLPDYAPGSTAVLTAAGFTAGETVEFHVTSETPGPGQTPWQVADGSAEDQDGLANGVVVTSWLVDPDGAYLGATLDASATGLTSALTATTRFTDSGNDTPINITEANGWTPGGSNGQNPSTVVSCPDGFVITKVAIKTGQGGGFVIENLTGTPGDQNLGPSHSPVITQNGFLGKGNAFSTTAPLSGPYYSVTGIGTNQVTVTGVGSYSQGGGGISHVDYFCEEDEPPLATLTIAGRKFEDINGNGTDDSDPGISGWEINITVGPDSFTVVTGNSYTYNASTNQLTDVGDLPNGGYAVLVTNIDISGGPVDYTIEEELQDGWTPTYGMLGYSGEINGDESVEGQSFGNFELFDIGGTKYTDVTGDGVSEDDTGLGGVVIFIDMDDSGDLSDGDLTTETADDGTWSFDDLDYTVAGKTVYEVVPGGYVQTVGEAGHAITGTSGADQDGLDFANFELFDISGVKFYDLDGDGLWDSDGVWNPGEEPAIAGWTIKLHFDANGNGVEDGGETVLTTVTDATGAYRFTDLGPLNNGLGNYIVTEGSSTYGGTWIQTGPAGGKYTVQATSGNDREDANFANIKLGEGGGHTIGFWGNKNGLALLTSAKFTELNSLSLRNADGSHRDFTGTLTQQKSALDKWLKDANATNMAYMLSAQLAAMKLNVLTGFVSGGALVYAPGVDGADANGFITIAALMLKADAALAADGYTPAGDPNRALQEVLKNALDAANNNLNFVLGLLDAWDDDNNNGVIDPGEI